MKYIPVNYDIPYYNMALEEYLLENSKFAGEEFLFFYIHKKSVILGRHQNAYAEVDLPFVNANGIIIARRLSGGGCVYHDGGNLNFSFILNKEKNRFIDFSHYTQPVVDALKSLGLPAELSGRNDIILNGKKISGNAEYVSGNRLLHHGTLLFDVDIEDMLASLNVDQIKITSKAIKSVRSRVANIREYLPQDFDINSLKEYLRKAFLQNGSEEYILDKDDICAVNEKVKNKFSLPEYNFGVKEKFSFEKKAKFPAGILSCGMEIKNGVIEKCSLSGDYFANKNVSYAEEALSGTKLERSSVEKKLCEIGFNEYIVNFTAEELLSLIFG